MTADVPSQETDAYWLVARAPKLNDILSPRVGKWMVFAYADQVDAAWAIISEATEKDTLGPESKVSTGRENPHSTAADTEVIIVYTRDYEDREDIARVLAELRRLGFNARLNYKTDDDTASGTYGKGASLYTSAEGSLDFTTPKARAKRKRP